MKSKTINVLSILLVILLSIGVIAINFKTIKPTNKIDNSETSINEKKNIKFIILARSDCYYCNKYKPIIDEIKNEYDIEIKYIDLKVEKSILNEDITIPAACNKYGKDIKINEGFGTPLSLFMKDNEVIDCIRGYTAKENVVAKIKKIYGI